MADRSRSSERLLCSVSTGGEQRRVSLISGQTCTVMELSSGPDTELAYGVARHGHKIVCEWEACARALGATRDEAEERLAALFVGATPAMLSDVMDLFDQAGEHYAYMAWDAGGDGIYRPGC